jgi:hypothetical protein
MVETKAVGGDGLASEVQASADALQDGYGSVWDFYFNRD